VQLIDVCFQCQCIYSVGFIDFLRWPFVFLKVKRLKVKGKGEFDGEFHIECKCDDGSDTYAKCLLSIESRSPVCRLRFHVESTSGNARNVTVNFTTKTCGYTAPDIPFPVQRPPC
jgi:hypothetical protein